MSKSSMGLSAIKRMEQLASSMPDVVSLSQGVPAFPSHPSIREAAVRAIHEGLTDKYSLVAGLPALRELISIKLSLQGMNYDPRHEIIVTAGGLEALAATIFALTEPYDEVIVVSPAYSPYRRIAALASVNVKTAVLSFTGSEFKLNIQAVLKLITPKTRLLILCSPNNPTGSLLSEQELFELGRLSQQHGFWIVSDDIYQNLCFDTHKLFTLAQAPLFKKNVVRIVSFSKDFSLAGWRIGFLHADAYTAARILSAHDVLMNCAPVVSQYAAIAALEHYDSIVAQSLKWLSENRQIMGSALSGLTDYVLFEWPAGGYYFFPKIKGMSDSEKFCLDLLNKARLATVPGSEFGEGGEGYVRLCFSKSPEEIAEGMRRLKSYFVQNK